MKTTIYLLIAFAVLGLSAGSHVQAADKSTKSSPVAGFSLQDYRGKNWSLADFAESKVMVVAFLGTECPLVKLYGGRLADLHAEYGKKGVAFVGINANTQDSISEIGAFARRHKIEFPILKDVGNKVADQFGAQRTPEVFVLDAARLVRYRGRIDDQYGVGYVRDKARRYDLKIALDELLAGKTVSQPSNKAVGCIIGRVHQPNADSTVTYSNQIARILQKRCVECHRAGEIAPFALTKYSEVAGWAEMIAEVIDEGRMPPWHAAPGHARYANDRSLTGDEKKLIATWVKNGAPEGDPKQVPEPETYVSGWQLEREPDAVFNIQQRPYEVPAQGAVRYQYFRVSTNFKEEKWMQGAQIVPGNRAVVHHVLAFAIDPKEGLAGLRELQGGSGGFLAAYVPGQTAYTFPKGMAKRIPAGATLVFQVHYTPIGTPQTDVSKIGFLFANPRTVTHQVTTTSAVARNFRIPPNDPNHEATAYGRHAAREETLVLGFMPHMHLRGKSFKYEAVLPDGKRQTLLDIPAYDFNWQTSYRLAEPLSFPAGTRMFCTAHWDNSEDNLNNPDPSKSVRWGSQTWEEMMIGYFDVATPHRPTPASQPAKKTEGNSESEKGASKAGAKKEAKSPAPAYVDRLFRLLDKNNDGKITRAEVPQRLLPRFDQVDADNNQEVTLEELRKAMAKKE